MSPACLNIAGLLFALVGILLLFRYGIPHRARTDGGIGMVQGQKDEADLGADNCSLGWIGLILVVLGTLFIPVFIR
jgi:hypothetical protein